MLDGFRLFAVSREPDKLSFFALNKLNREKKNRDWRGNDCLQAMIMQVRTGTNSFHRRFMALNVTMNG